MTYQDNQIKKFLKEPDRRNLESYLNKNGERKMLHQFYSINNGDNIIIFTDDKTKEVQKNIQTT